MLFFNTDVRYNFNFTFNGNNIPITMSHKHLGVTLSSSLQKGIIKSEMFLKGQIVVLCTVGGISSLR
jgi:hypothetical protein